MGKVWRAADVKQKFPSALLLILLGPSLVGNMVSPAQVAKAQNSTTPLAPYSINVLVVSRATYYGTGYLLSDLARYGFNVTWHSADSGTDYTTATKAANINQYDVVILHQTLTSSGEPSLVTEAEVAYFTKTFGGVLILAGNSLMRNETSGAWHSFTSAPMVQIESRLGVDFTAWAASPYKANGTFYRISDLIPGLPHSIPYLTTTGADIHHLLFTLNGATELYNFTRVGTTQHLRGITYYKNATGAVGIYINGIYEYKTETSMVPYYWGFYGGKYEEMTATNIGLRAGLLARLIAYALDRDINTIIKPQPMAIFRVDDFVSTSVAPYFNDANQTNAMQKLYNLMAEFDAPASLAFLVDGFANYPLTIQKAKDLELQDIGWSFETHFRHQDYTAYSVAEVESLIDASISDYSAYGFEKFTVGIAPAGRYADNVYTAMANKGMYLLDLTNIDNASARWYDTKVNGSVILKGAFQPVSQTLFIEESKDYIHYRYYAQRSKFALAIINGAPTIFTHPNGFAMDETGTWAYRTFYWNLTAEIPDVKFTTNQVFAQYFGKKWAVISNPSRSGNALTFTVNVDNVPTAATIEKGMLWYRINTSTSSTIQSVKLNGLDWYAFDDYSIRIPAQNTNIEVTLGAPATPYIKEFDRKITATSYKGSKLQFTTESLSGTTSTSTIYCGDEGEPKSIYVSNGSLSWNFNASTSLLELQVTHSSNIASVIVDWRTPGDVNADGKVDSSDLTALSEAYGSVPFTQNWNEDCDFNADNKINISDLYPLGRNYLITP